MYRSLSAGLETILIGEPAFGGGRDGDDGHDVLDGDAACRAVEACRGDRDGMMTLRSTLAGMSLSAALTHVDDAEVVGRIQWGLRSGALRARRVLRNRGTFNGGTSSGGTSNGGTGGGSAPLGGAGKRLTRRALFGAPRPLVGGRGPLAFDPDPLGATLSSSFLSSSAAASAVAVAAPPTLSFYVVQVQDELGTGIAGIDVELTTPAGTQTLRTDGAGLVRVDQVPPGNGTARIVTAGADLAAALAGRVQQPKRRSPLPDDDLLAIATPARAAAVVSFPDAVTQRIMLVSRTDLVWGSVAPRWGDLPLLSDDDDAARLVDAGFGDTLQLCAAGTSARAVLGLTPNGVTDDVAAGESDPSPSDIAIDVDALHDALFSSDFDAVRAVLDRASTEPPSPPEPPDFPAPSAEGALFAASLAALALQGVVDAPFVPGEQV